MSTFYLYDGRNEVGPLTIEGLKNQRLTRNTPIRQRDSNSWFPAEKITELKEVVAPRKIRRPKDIVPAMIERVTDLNQRKPKTLYGSLLCIALLLGVSIYSIGKTAEKIQPKQTVVATKIESVIHTPAPPVRIAPKKKKKPLPAKEDATIAARLRWNKLISASNSNYGIGVLGGIKDLSVTVNNRSAYPIDEAVINVTYIKASGGVWKTKLVTVYGVPAHDSKEQALPDVGRGKKVKVSLYKVISKKMKFSFTEGQKITNKQDPYFKE